MVQAAQELIPRVFGVPVLTARVHTTNVASVRALTRRSFVADPAQEGLLVYRWRASSQLAG